MRIDERIAYEAIPINSGIRLENVSCLSEPIPKYLSIADRKYSGPCSLSIAHCLGRRHRTIVLFANCPVYYLTFRQTVIIIKGSEMAKISSEEAVAQIGNRFQLVLVASQRARELKSGHAAKIQSEDCATITALREIEEGKYTLKDYLGSLPAKRKGHRE